MVPLLLDGTAVDLKADVVFFDDDVADAGLVAGLHGWSPERHQTLQFRAAGGHGAVSEGQSSLPHGKTRVDIDQFCIEDMDNFFAGFFGNPLGPSVLGER